MRIGRYRFKPAPMPSALFLLLFPLLVALGLWQLSRADEKREWIELQRQRAAEPPIRLTDATGLQALRYRQVTAKGDYDAEHQFLLDNQVMNGIPGFSVMTPLKLDDHAAVLVNRGWVPAGPDRTRRGDLSVEKTAVEITGRVNSFPSVGLQLKGAEIPSKGWPALVQVIDPEVLSDILGYRLLSFQLYLDKTLPEGFRREWKRGDAFEPEKHIGYAVQWFALAAALALIFLWRSFKA